MGFEAGQLKAAQASVMPPRPKAASSPCRALLFHHHHRFSSSSSRLKSRPTPLPPGVRPPVGHKRPLPGGWEGLAMMGVGVTAVGTLGAAWVYYPMAMDDARAAAYAPSHLLPLRGVARWVGELAAGEATSPPAISSVVPPGSLAALSMVIVGPSMMGFTVLLGDGRCGWLCCMSLWCWYGMVIW